MINPKETQMPSLTKIFGSHVFDLRTMKACLSKPTFNALKRAIDGSARLSLEEANEIAHAMMEWAVGLNATHYTHWFQPLTGRTAQKHDAFLTLDEDFTAIERFSGSQLIQSEPDASSFPSGGMRSTFEARGYTAWDPSSPVFVMQRSNVAVLCIPSVFLSYTGHALDKKTPLLRSERVLNQSASESLELLTGRKPRVFSTVGAEQEYFLVDQEFFNQRPDLIMAGRTLIGCQPPKGQQMEDHYFGTIKDRVLMYMEAVERELYRLGVPCKTRHNEVAPHQFEMAPIFQKANLAADHNQLTMDVMQKVAKEHGLEVLLNEKPFAGVNGSGKHLNWSMQTDEGTNLLEPGSTPHKNLRFLYFLVAAVHAIHKRGDVLRSTIASSGNDHRLGANEAPPAIMSVFLGSHLSGLLDLVESSMDLTSAVISEIDLGLAELPQVVRDTTDRNRTSPFAFTGNKFEFRAVGSSQSVSLPTVILNMAVAESLDEMNAMLETQKDRSEKSILSVLRHFIKRSKPIRFEGNNYADAWVAEAEKRGLPNLRTTPEALIVWERDDVREFLTRSGVLAEPEIEARMHVKLEGYAKEIDIESSTLLRMVDNHVLPSSFRHQTHVAQSIQALAQATASAGMDAAGVLGSQAAYLDKISSHIARLLASRDELEAKVEAAPSFEHAKESAFYYRNQIVPVMDRVRSDCDSLESLVDANDWALPTYHELLFML
ncbi:MAG: glutamine synthetase III [Acidobacteria bacterium]|nr:glutamine synthetase III [Acidobacteriota bacterium]